MKHLMLGGGRAWKGEDQGKRWVQTLLARCVGEAKVAFCLFAQDESQWTETIKANTELITRHAVRREVSTKILHPDDFEQTSKWANIILIPGGDPMQLKETLKQFGDLMKLWDGKTIAGSSAGADIMCERFVYLQDKTFHRGFGWVRANLIPHWQASDWKGWTEADWHWAADELANKSGGTPLLCIREADFVEVAVQ